MTEIDEIKKDVNYLHECLSDVFDMDEQLVVSLQKYIKTVNEGFKKIYEVLDLISKVLEKQDVEIHTIKYPLE
jgi:hypothetical protein